ncbi:transketolase family protein [Candidatus Kaiserbacteria bacterium]|nr:transketolase family protein [Candidatus Kaiserbacteria bacterium]
MPAEHLNKKLFDEDIERVPNRDGFGEGLREAGERDKQVVALCGDLTESTRMSIFAEQFPERFVQVGVAEQSMASVASGMAAMGKVPFMASYAMFSPGRNWEQIRTTIAYNNTNVKIIGSHAGVSVGPDGATHQAIEDIALTRVMPNMTVVVPCDSIEAKKATLAAASHIGPLYIRLAREKTPVVTTADSPFVVGKAEVYLSPEGKEKKIGIIACGTILHNALLAGKRLNDEGIGTSVMNLATIKPLDEEAVLAYAKEHEVIVTVEEHQIAGGMGSAVAELLSEKHPLRVVRIGVRDQFGQSGEPDELLKHYGIDVDSLYEAAKNRAV